MKRLLSGRVNRDAANGKSNGDKAASGDVGDWQVWKTGM
jgi:hypothetical protein